MNQAHFHLVVNHLPIILPIAGVLVLIGGIVFRSEIVKRMAYFLFAIGAVSALSAMTSGEGAEEIAETLPGVTDNVIHEHEESAELFALLSYVFGALSLFAMWASWKKKKISSLLTYLVLIFSLIVLFLGRQTGTTGGEIRHTEIRSDQSSIQSETDRQENNQEEDED